ncbi:hypothetical protein FACS1894130_10510 [Spirochaetia bacterium]|nr:hypothetical protein FACS1894130_10510 [Spirochaetia bacterium]
MDVEVNEVGHGDYFIVIGGSPQAHRAPARGRVRLPPITKFPQRVFIEEYFPEKHYSYPYADKER